MKIICAWCGKVIQDGPEETVSHGVCEECVIHVVEPERNGSEPPLPDFCEGVVWGMKSLILGGLLFNLALGIVILVVETLHALTGGWIPGIVQW
jgi:hypothetical protein